MHCCTAFPTHSPTLVPFPSSAISGLVLMGFNFIILSLFFLLHSYLYALDALNGAKAIWGSLDGVEDDAFCKFFRLF